ncbi:MAG: hypothetical protein IPK80_14140 [Nannocystis sp.]|nr:hypothetical protein [Nannocystis sp.]
MQRCHTCSRHVWETEPRCPFCAAPLRLVGAAPSFALSALIGVMVLGCVGDDSGGATISGSDGTTSASSTGTDSMSSTSGATDSGSGSGSTSSSGSTSDSGSSGTESTSTTTTTSSTSSSTTSDTTSDTTGDTSSGCDGRGEQICDGVCVNTNQDPEHCGECLNVCDGEMGQACVEGECVVILPYGAPMPEPLWA